MPLTEADFQQLIATRNQFLSNTDKLMLVPDLPEDIRNDLKAYRTAMRNITTKFGTEWTEPEHVNWPEYPKKLRFSSHPTDK